MDTMVVALTAGLLFAGGTIATIVGLVGTTGSPGPDRPTADWRRVGRRLVAGAAVGAAAAAAWAATGWPVAALLTIAAVWLAPHSLRAAAARRRERDVLDATRMWLLQLRTTLRAGVGLEQALRETARQTRPDSPLAEPLRAMVERLQWLRAGQALALLADELDNHVADTTVVVLRSALEHSQRDVAAALQALGEWADDDLAVLRQVDTEARQVQAMKWLTLTVTAAVAGYMMLSSPELMAAYRTLEGQLVLVALIGLAGLSLWLLTRWSGLPRPERFFHRGEAG